METLSTTTAREGKSTPDGCTCFECDAQTRTEWREHAFAYGVGASTVELNVTLPVRVCNSCGFEFLDHEAETLQHEAICAHLDVLTPKETGQHSEAGTPGFIGTIGSAPVPVFRNRPFPC